MSEAVNFAAGAARLLGIPVIALGILAGCGRRPSTLEAAKERSATEMARQAERLGRVRSAEYAKEPRDVPNEALTSHDPVERLASAIALARMRVPAAGVPLRKLLADEDNGIAAWAAFGLGAVCAGQERDTVAAVVARTATWLADPAHARPTERRAVSFAAAAAETLAHCGTEDAETALRQWLEEPDLAASAARALGRLAARRHALADTTLVALLDGASKADPSPAFFDAFAHLGLQSPAMRRQLADAAARTAIAARPGGESAMRALSAAPTEGAPLLSKWVLSDLPLTARTVAALTLAHLDPPTEEPAIAIRTLVARAKNDAEIVSQGPVLLALLGGVADPGAVRPALTRLATLPTVSDAATRRRRVALRCRAARVLAGQASLSRALVDCDFGEHGRSYQLATLAVLDTSKLEGPRAETFEKLLDSKDPVVRRSALSALSRHPELEAADDLLIRALGAKEPSVVTEAARLLATLPGRAAASAAKDDDSTRDVNPKIAGALGAALDSERPEDEIAPRAALLKAAGALGVLSLKPRVERYCKSPQGVLRDSAERALRALGNPKAECPPPKTSAPAKTVSAPSGAKTLTFVTDVGRLGLTLDPEMAPLAVERILELARGGFYDGIAVHRVVPGSLVQFGDRGGDGYGGAGKTPLPDETSPLEFAPFTVGLALAGPDTGSSQFFVALSDQPDLFGDYPVLGYADPDWALLQEGDVVRRVEIAQ